MAFWEKWFETKTSSQDVMQRIIQGNRSSSGAYVSTDSAMQVASVYACVRVISETVASLPLRIYKKQGDGGRSVASTHPLYNLLHSSPNPHMTSFEFREMMQASLCLRGNAYAHINWTGKDVVSELTPLNPDTVRVNVERDGTRTYTAGIGTGAEYLLKADEVLHIRGISSDGILGRSVLQDARESIGVSIATQQYAASFYKNDATPAIALKHPGKISKDVGDRLRDQWTKAHGGSSQARSTAVLEEGMTIERLSMNADDAQFLETRKFQRSEIAGLFRVPPHMIGDLDKATFSNIEHQSIEFVTHCIRPWLVRWEQALSKALFTVPELYYPEHSVDGVLRGDIKSRYEAYAIARNWGWLSVNDIRALENQNSINNGDIYLQPLNMANAGVNNAQ